MSQAGLSEVDPVLVDPVAVTEQNAGPIIDQGQKSLLGAVRMDHEISDGPTGHGPQPHQGAIHEPGGLIDVIDLGFACYPTCGFVVGFDGFRDAIDDFLNCPLADGKAQYGGAKILHSATTVSLNTTKFGNAGTEFWTIAGLMTHWNAGLIEFPTTRARPLVKDETGDLHLGFWVIRFFGEYSKVGFMENQDSHMSMARV